MAYTTLAQGSSVTLTFNDEFDSVEVINRTQDLAAVSLVSGAWSYGASPQQHSGRRVYSLLADGSVSINAVSGAVQYEQTSATDNRATLSVAQATAIRSAASGQSLGVTLDGSNRMATMTNNISGRVATINYTDATHLTISDNLPNQAVGTLVLDSGGRLVSYSGNFP